MPKEGQPAVTVIVTVHNAEKYLQECMDSVIGQTLPELEILCMDGGSTDGSPKILKQYAERDDRIRIINDPNASYGHKVNCGIAKARGKYIAVLESDDMYEPFMLERLYEVAEKYHADFVDADYTNFYDINGVRFTHVTRMYQPCDYSHLIHNRAHPEQMRDIPRFWTGIFLKDFLDREQIRMNESEGASFQDMSFRFLTSVLAGTSYHLDMPVYRYRIDNPDSSMHDPRKTTVIADEHAFLQKELTKRGIQDSMVWHNAYRWKYRDFRGNLYHLAGQYQMELFTRYREELERDRVELERYRMDGYDPFVREMIENSASDMKRLLECESKEQALREKRKYEFLEKVTGIDTHAQVVLFGYGRTGRIALDKLKFMEDKICAVTDNDSRLWGSRAGNKPVLAPAEAVAWYPQAYYLIANQKSIGEIQGQLLESGILQEKIIIFEEYA